MDTSKARIFRAEVVHGEAERAGWQAPVLQRGVPAGSCAPDARAARGWGQPERCRPRAGGPARHAAGVGPAGGGARGGGAARHLPGARAPADRAGGAPAAAAGERPAAAGGRVPKKSSGVLREGVAVKDKYAVIAQHRDAYPVPLMCRALEVSASGFYAAQRRPASARAGADERLRVQVRAAHAESRRRYGAPRVHRELRAQGTRVAKKRVARLMREDGLVARRPRRFVRTTDSAHAQPVAPNHLARRFAVGEIGGPDRVWASDITYVPTREGWLYLAVVLDLASRRVVGWAMRHTLERGLTLDALQMALDQRRPGRGVLYHSDRGSQYACGDYRALLTQH